MKKVHPEPFLIDVKGIVIFGIILITAIVVRHLIINVDFGSFQKEHIQLCRLCPDQPVSDFRLTLLGKRSDINKASYEELIMVPGIGEKTAQKILQFRQDVGFILDLNELLIPYGPLDSMTLACLKRRFKQSF